MQGVEEGNFEDVSRRLKAGLNASIRRLFGGRAASSASERRYVVVRDGAPLFGGLLGLLLFFIDIVVVDVLGKIKQPPLRLVFEAAGFQV